MSITISSGHWFFKGSGASGVLNEVTENRRVVKRVVEILKQSNVTVTELHDNVSSNMSSNLGYLVREHNKSKRDLDVSVHFNASAGTQTKGIGTEVLYVNPNLKQKAKELSSMIAIAGGFKDRGEKYRNNLGFLNGTTKPALLIEVCFVNSHEDAKLYNQNFEKICQAIAEKLAEYVGKKITSPTPSVSSSTYPTVDVKEDNIMLNETGRKEARLLIKRAVKEGLFDAKFHTDAKVDKYSDIELMSYCIAYMNRKLK